MEQPKAENRNKEIYKLIYKAYQKRYFIFVSFFSLVLIVLVSGRAFVRFGKDNINFYVNIDKAFNNILKKEQLSKNISEMKSLLLKREYLQPNYQGILGQHLYNIGYVDQASIFAENAIKRTNNEVEVYSSYSKTSILINNKNFEKALSDAKQLDEKLNNQKDNHLSLYSYNLLRIAILNKILGHKNEEKLACTQLKNHLDTYKGNLKNTQAAQEINSFINNFHRDNDDIHKYISSRLSTKN